MKRDYWPDFYSVVYGLIDFNPHCTLPTTAKEAVARANSNIRDENGDEVAQDSLLSDALADHFTDGRKGAISTRYLGDFLSKIKGRIECGARFEQAGSSNRATLWRVKVLDPRRFEASFNESNESNESVRSQPAFFRQKILGNMEKRNSENSKIKKEKNLYRGQVTHLTHSPHHVDTFPDRGEVTPQTLLTPSVDATDTGENWENF